MSPTPKLVRAKDALCIYSYSILKEKKQELKSNTKEQLNLSAYLRWYRARCKGICGPFLMEPIEILFHILDVHLSPK